MLAYPDLSCGFRLNTDASQYAVGTVLAQEFDGSEKVIQYLSHQLDKGQQNWPTIEREMYAIIFGIKKLRHFLLGHRFTMYTDHSPLWSIFTAEMKYARVERWTIMMDEFHCGIQYKTGKKQMSLPIDCSV